MILRNFDFGDELTRNTDIITRSIILSNREYELEIKAMQLNENFSCKPEIDIITSDHKFIITRRAEFDKTDLRDVIIVIYFICKDCKIHRQMSQYYINYNISDEELIIKECLENLYIFPNCAEQIIRNIIE